MVQLPFSATAAAVLVGAMIAGGTIGVMTSPPAEAPSVEASAAPVAGPVTAPSSEPEAATRPPVPKVEQIVVEPAPPTDRPAPEPPVTVQQSETTTVVSAPVIVTSLGIVSGCVGCVEHRIDDKAHHPEAKTERTEPPQHAAVRREIPHVRFLRPPQVASASLRRR